MCIIEKKLFTTIFGYTAVLLLFTNIDVDVMLCRNVCKCYSYMYTIHCTGGEIAAKEANFLSSRAWTTAKQLGEGTRGKGQWN